MNTVTLSLDPVQALMMVLQGEDVPLEDLEALIRSELVRFSEPWNWTLTPEGRKALEHHDPDC